MPLKCAAPEPFRAVGETATIAQAGKNEDGSPKLATFSGNAYTGAEMRPYGWGGRIIVKLSGIKIPNQHRPALRQHDHNQIVGHTTGIDVTDKGVMVEGPFSGE